MTTRKELYQRFGPLLIEAMCLVIKDEINTLRLQHGLPERTNQQILTAIGNKLDSLTAYDWMTEEP